MNLTLSELETLEEICRDERARLYLPESVTEYSVPGEFIGREVLAEIEANRSQPYRFEPFLVYTQQSGTRLPGRIMQGTSFVSQFGSDTCERIVEMLNTASL